MTLQTPKQIAAINQALRSRGMMPTDGYCSCDHCGDKVLDRDDMAREEQFQTGILARVLGYTNLTEICRGCADDVTSESDFNDDDDADEYDPFLDYELYQ